ncbi:MAG TPA: phage baseplate assembly protein V [Streptosporangiaceae bacterium]|jgi:hypothetical protein
MRQFFGKYRGTVVANVDPRLRGRVQVSVPEVLGQGQLSWAEPCVPYAGQGVGLFAVPPVGATVWVEFEAGDPDYPIVSGGLWGSGQQPAPGMPEVKVLKTDCITITLSDVPGDGGLSIEVGPPAVPSVMKLTITAAGIELVNGANKISLSPASVSVNDGALEVT